jgi:hypothetical protein
VDPLVTNSFALLGGGFNMIQTPESNVPKNREGNSRRITSRHLLQLQTKLLKPFEKPSSKSGTNPKFEILSPYDRKRKLTKVQDKEKISNSLKRVKVSKEDERHGDSNLALYNHQSRDGEGNYTLIFFLIKFSIHVKLTVFTGFPPGKPKHITVILISFVGTTDETFCNPYLKFTFDRTFLSEDKSLPSQPTNTIRFLDEPGSTGKTSAFFDGNGFITVWGMSYITFAFRFKFVIRFKLRPGYPYRDEFYSLISDGPCGESLPRYSVSFNPVRSEFHSYLMLRNNDEVDLLLTDVVGSIFFFFYHIMYVSCKSHVHIMNKLVLELTFLAKRVPILSPN